VHIQTGHVLVDLNGDFCGILDRDIVI
jgi:hypothetical protein